MPEVLVAVRKHTVGRVALVVAVGALTLAAAACVPPPPPPPPQPMVEAPPPPPPPLPRPVRPGAPVRAGGELG
jgi:hypothetical protein